MQTESLPYNIPVTLVELDLSDEYIEQCINEIKKIGDQMDHTTNLKCMMTAYEALLEHPLFEEIRAKIANKIESHPYAVKDYNFQYVDMWGAIYYKQEGAVPHMHLPNTLSFCLYLKADENSSPLELLSDYEKKIVYQPKKNGLVIFPSFVMHQVEPQEKDSERVIISGNIVMI